MSIQLSKLMKTTIPGFVLASLMGLVATEAKSERSYGSFKADTSVTSCTQQNAKTRAELTTCNADLVAQKEMVTKTRDQYNEASEKLSSCEGTLQACGAAVAECSSDAEGLDDKVSGLNKSLESQIAALEKSKSSDAASKKALADLKAEHAKVQGELEASKKEEARLKALSAERGKTIGTLQDAHTRKNAKIAELNGKHAALAADHQKLKGEHDKYKAKANEIIRSLGDSSAALKERLKAANTKLFDAQTRADMCETVREAALKELESAGKGKKAAQLRAKGKTSHEV